MGLIQHAIPPKTSDTPIIENTLSYEDVDVIIRVLGNSTFSVRDIETLYRAIYKLQELRNKLKNDAS